MEDAGGEPPLEDGSLTENVGTSESVESSSCLCGSSVDDNSGLLSVFSISPSPVPVCCHSAVEMPASTVCSLCLKCFKCLGSKTKIKCLHHNKLSWCSVCMDLNKPCVGILWGFHCKYNECLELAQNGASTALEDCVKELGNKVNHFHSATSKCKVEHNLLESHCLQYSQLQLQFLTLNELCEVNRKPALPESEMEIGFKDLFL